MLQRPCRVRSRTGGQQMAPAALKRWMSRCAAGCRASARAPWPASQAAMSCWGASPTAQRGRAESGRPCCGHGRATGERAATQLIPPNLRISRRRGRVPGTTCSVTDTKTGHHSLNSESDAMLHSHLQLVHMLHQAGGQLSWSTVHVIRCLAEQALGSIKSVA